MVTVFVFIAFFAIGVFAQHTNENNFLSEKRQTCQVGGYQGGCASCTPVAGCTSLLSCTSGLDSRCTSCVAGYRVQGGTPSTADSCVACPANCKSCSSTTCTECFSGFTLSATATCVASSCSSNSECPSNSVCSTGRPSYCSIPATWTTYGSFTMYSHSTTCAMKLTPGGSGKHGSVKIPMQTFAPWSTISLQFQVKIGGASPGDGLSINFGPNLILSQTTAEGSYATWNGNWTDLSNTFKPALSLLVDTFANDGAVSNGVVVPDIIGLGIRNNSTIIAELGGFNIRPWGWIPASFTVNYAGFANFTWGGYSLTATISNWGTLNGDLLIAAHTGAATDAHEVKDVRLSVTTNNGVTINSQRCYCSGTCCIDSDCATGYVCNLTSNSCVRGCVSNSDCAAPYVCSDVRPYPYCTTPNTWTTHGSYAAIANTSGSGFCSLQLTQAVVGQYGVFKIPMTNTGWETVNLRLQVRIGGGNSADGFSINFGQNLILSQTTAEGSYATWNGNWTDVSNTFKPALSFLVDTFANDGAVNNGVVVPDIIGLGIRKDSAILLQRSLSNIRTYPDWVNVSISIGPTGLATFLWGVEALQASIPGWRGVSGDILIAAHTGGAYDYHEVRDVKLSVDTIDSKTVTSLTCQCPHACCANSDCPTNYVCNPTLHTCSPASSCSSNAQCTSPSVCSDVKPHPDCAIPSTWTAYGTATPIANPEGFCSIRLTQAVVAQHGVIKIPMQTYAPWSTISLQLSVRIGGGNSADGFSINFGENLIMANTNVEGSYVTFNGVWEDISNVFKPALSFLVDTYVNFQAVSNGALIPDIYGLSIRRDSAIVGGLTLTNANVRSHPNWITVWVNVTSTGTASFLWGTNPVLTATIPNWGTLNGDLLIAAHTGGANDIHEIRDVRLSITTTGGVTMYSQSCQ